MFEKKQRWSVTNIGREKTRKDKLSIVFERIFFLFLVEDDPFLLPRFSFRQQSTCSTYTYYLFESDTYIILKMYISVNLLILFLLFVIMIIILGCER